MGDTPLPPPARKPPPTDDERIASLKLEIAAIEARRAGEAGELMTKIVEKLELLIEVTPRSARRECLVEALQFVRQARASL